MKSRTQIRPNQSMDVLEIQNWVLHQGQGHPKCPITELSPSITPFIMPNLWDSHSRGCLCGELHRNIIFHASTQPSEFLHESCHQIIKGHYQIEEPLLNCIIYFIPICAYLFYNIHKIEIRCCDRDWVKLVLSSCCNFTLVSEAWGNIQL